MLVNLEEYQVKILADIAENLVLSSCLLADGSFVSKLHLSESVLSEMQEISCLLDVAAENMPIQISDVTGFININNSTVSFDDVADDSALVSINMSNDGAAVSLSGVAPALHTHQAADVSGVAPALHTHQAADVSGVALAAHAHRYDSMSFRSYTYTGTGAEFYRDLSAATIPAGALAGVAIVFDGNGHTYSHGVSNIPQSPSVRIPVAASVSGVQGRILVFFVTSLTTA